MTKATMHDTEDRNGRHRLQVAIDLDGDDLTDVDIVDAVLDDIRPLLEREIRARVDVHLNSYVDDICARHGVDLDDLRSNRRDLQAVRARQEVCGTLHDAGWSLNRIGRLLERHHTTILHAVRQWEARHVEVVRDDCEVCGAPSLGGGRWCLRHFQQHVDRGREQSARNIVTAANARYKRSA